MNTEFIRNLLISLAVLTLVFVGLWFIEQSNNTKRLYRNDMSDKIAKKLLAEKKRIYASNPNLDFDLPVFSIQRDNPTARPVNIAFEGGPADKPKSSTR